MLGLELGPQAGEDVREPLEGVQCANVHADKHMGVMGDTPIVDLLSQVASCLLEAPTDVRSNKGGTAWDAHLGHHGYVCGTGQYVNVTTRGYFVLFAPLGKRFKSRDFLSKLFCCCVPIFPLTAYQLSVFVQERAGDKN